MTAQLHHLQRAEKRREDFSGVPRPRQLAVLDKTFAGFHDRLSSYGSHNESSPQLFLPQHPEYVVQRAPYRRSASQQPSRPLAPRSFVSCKAGTEEAKDWIEGVETVAVKEGYGRNCALSLHPEDAQEQIRKGVARAVGKLHEIQPVRIPPPYELQIEYKLESTAEAEVRATGSRRIDSRTIVRKSEDIFEVY